MPLSAASGVRDAAVGGTSLDHLWTTAAGDSAEARASPLVPTAPHRPAALHGRVFRGSEVVRAGILTRAQLRGASWQRVWPDVYVCACTPLTHTTRALATGLLLPGSAVCGRSAAALWGVDLVEADADVECTVPVGVRTGRVPGLRLSRRALTPADVTTRYGRRVTAPARTVLDLARTRPLEEAVVLVDRFVATGPAELAEVRAAASTLTGRDCRHVRRVLELADGLAESPPETRLRLLLGSVGLPSPVAQFTVRDSSGRFLARVDFAWPHLRLALEYEGRWHGQPQQVAPDRRRLNRLTDEGWRVVFATAEDLARPERLLERLGALLDASRSH